MPPHLHLIHQFGIRARVFFMRKFSTCAVRYALRRSPRAPAKIQAVAGTATSSKIPPTTAAPPTSKLGTTTSVFSPSAVSSAPRTNTSSTPEPSKTSTAPTSAPIIPAASDPSILDGLDDEEDFTSMYGLGSKPFDPRITEILMAPVVPDDVEITPDGLLYLPEIKYRRILNRAFGPGGWGIAPRTRTLVTKRQVTREYGLVCLGRLVSVSRGEMDYFSQEGITTAMEGCKSNALMRCCKDLGIASELWDPAFIRQFKTGKCDSKYFEKKKRFVWKRKDRQWEYPYV